MCRTLTVMPHSSISMAHPTFSTTTLIHSHGSFKTHRRRNPFRSLQPYHVMDPFPRVYDPAQAYEFQYRAPGSPALAERALGLLAAAGIPAAADASRGFDHGTFVPLMLAFPDATIPVVQMSLHKSMDPRLHLSVGAALAPLRDEGVLIVSSGMSFHNMGVFQSNGFGMGASSRNYKPSEDFDSWLQQAVTGSVGARRSELLAAWSKAPGARECHPREEHLIPLMVAAGAAGADAGRTDYSDWFIGTKVSGFMFGG
ncbi:hypothetical protein Vretimale_16513 [Volvox reticuliferus]|uniref:Extradiol ring-cleavage dioxygenase class III enzyme subunit B domain-containing protein n=1 Tax=Volvox reticuliferus TaxID=1737510 RepID=A0A8J4LXF6_9CHLO|nr:hypothetical protein Vretimale_16513 [Volvox reticuliferus]